MKNISKTKAIVIGRKPKKIDMRIKDESVEQVESFKYLECNINSNMNCYQELKQRIPMAKGSFEQRTETKIWRKYCLTRIQHLLGRLNEKLFPEHGRCKYRCKENQVHKICR